MRTVWLCWHNDSVVEVTKTEEKAEEWLKQYIGEFNRDHPHCPAARMTDRYYTNHRISGARIKIEPRELMQ